jgi:hypothetical protein
VQLNRMIFYLGVDTSGLFGLVLLIGVTVVVPFVFFGQLLSSSGGANFFNDLSLGLMGRFRGGAAKISVLASSLFGSINGIVVSNILATGVITIPMMKKSGFKPEQAAAIEASSSNGGQLMPPVMGAVAFLMADFLQISYAQVAIAALVPSLLYYLALFIQADLEAAKGNIRRVPGSQIPRLCDGRHQGLAVCAALRGADLRAVFAQRAARECRDLCLPRDDADRPDLRLCEPAPDLARDLELRRAHRRLFRRHHHDRGGGGLHHGHPADDRPRLRADPFPRPAGGRQHPRLVGDRGAALHHSGHGHADARRLCAPCRADRPGAGGGRVYRRSPRTCSSSISA